MYSLAAIRYAPTNIYGTLQSPALVETPPVPSEWGIMYEEEGRDSYRIWRDDALSPVELDVVIGRHQRIRKFPSYISFSRVGSLTENSGKNKPEDHSWWPPLVISAKAHSARGWSHWTEFEEEDWERLLERYQAGRGPFAAAAWHRNSSQSHRQQKALNSALEAITVQLLDDRPPPV